MTTLFVFGAELPDIPNPTDRIINYHVQLSQARFEPQLEALLTEGQPLNLAEMPWPYALDDYRAEIFNLDNEFELWQLRDDRLLLFLPDVAALVKEARLVWITDDKPGKGFEMVLHKLAERVFAAFEGEKLKLAKPDTAAVKKWASGKAPARKAADK